MLAYLRYPSSQTPDVLVSGSVKLAAALFSTACAALGGPAADLAGSLRHAGLDPQQCYRVRDLDLSKGDARFYFGDGYLIFGKPAGGTRASAVFSADVEGGDAELLLLPPDRSERRSLANWTGSPNMDEHLRAALFIFTDDTWQNLNAQIRSKPSNRPAPEMGLLMAEHWTPVVQNITSSFEARMVLGLLGAPRTQDAFFAAVLQGKTLGNFDLIYDSRGAEQLVVGQVSSRPDRAMFDVWSSFTARASRNSPANLEFRLDDYRIETTVEPDLRIKARTRMKLIPGRERQRVIALELSRQMVVTSAAVDGRAAEVFQTDSLRGNLIRNDGNALFLIVPAAPLDSAHEHELEIHHEGAVIAESQNHVYYVSSRGNWYPRLGLEFARYNLTFRYPRDLDLVAAGDIREDRTEGEWRVTRRAVGAPIRLAGFNLGVYDHLRLRRSTFDVEICANRAAGLAGAPRLQELASEVGAAMEFMAGRFGPPALSSLVVSPIPGLFGQGFPGLIYLSLYSYFSPGAKPLAAFQDTEQMFFTDVLQAHETAHQWWGNVVTSAGYHDDWLMEALSNYSALLYQEKRKGPRAVEIILDSYRRNLLAKTDGGHTVESVGPIVLGGRLETSQAPAAWKNIIYGKGSWIIHMLRRRMGDERFLAMLAELRRRYEWRGVSTDQFRLLASEFLPPDSADPKLEAFFDQWVYGTGIPLLKLNYAVRGRPPAVRLTGTVVQTDVDDDFTVQVPVAVEMGGEVSVVTWVRTSSEAVSFAVSLKHSPARVMLDPGYNVLAVER